MSVKSDHAVQPVRGYEPPTLVVLGTVAEVTAGAAFPGTDLGQSPPAVSDRRLKRDRQSVRLVDVLSALAELS